MDHSKHSTDVVERYKSIGLFTGLLMGGVAGAIVAGPHIHDWSALKSGATVLGCFVLGGFIGYGAAALALGSEASIGNAFGSDGSNDDGSGGGGDGGGGGDS